MINILIAGDYRPIGPVQKFIDEGLYDKIFSEVRQYTYKSDYSIVNFESPVVLNEVKPIDKIGPALKCSPSALDAIKYAGFDCVTLANNHFYDYGDNGVIDTITSCKNRDIDYVGGGNNIEEAEQILYKEIGGKKFAFINFCENEFSIATSTSCGAAPLNPIRNFYQIRDAKSQADYVIVIIHGGIEYYHLPTPRMQATYKFFIDVGADVIVNHHQHCFSGFEVYKNRPIFYGLGNFCYYRSKSDKLWVEGIVVIIKFSDQISFEIHPYIQCKDSESIIFMRDMIQFRKKMEELNSIICDEQRLKECFDDMVSSKYKKYNVTFEPYANKYLKALYLRNLIPSFITKKQRKVILNLIRCDSHRDILLKALQHKL